MNNDTVSQQSNDLPDLSGLLGTPDVPSDLPPMLPGPSKKSGFPKVILVFVVLFILISLAIIGVTINNNRNIADLRNSAYSFVSCDNPLSSCSTIGNSCTINGSAGTCVSTDSNINLCGCQANATPDPNVDTCTPSGGKCSPVTSCSVIGQTSHSGNCPAITSGFITSPQVCCTAPTPTPQCQNGDSCVWPASACGGLQSGSCTVGGQTGVCCKVGSNVCNSTTTTAQACRGQSDGYVVPGTCTCKMTNTTTKDCACVVPTSALSPTPTIAGGGSCGADGAACCDPLTHNGLICNANLYCNTSTGNCQSTPPTNICGGSQGSGGSIGSQCVVYNCGSQCNQSGQCNQNPQTVPCSSASLNGSCGQIDYLDTNGSYCGVKTLNCGGSCSTGGGGSTPVPTSPPNNTPVPTATTRPTNTPTRTPTPTPTNTPVPTATPVPQCGSACTSSTQCPTGLTCSGGTCKMNECVTNPGSCTSNGCNVLPTATPVTGQCLNILVYKNNVLVTPSTLQPGDQVVFGINASPGITRARIRINGAGMNNEVDNWTILTTKVGNEFRSAVYTFPTGTTNFTIEGQIEAGTNNWL